MITPEKIAQTRENLRERLRVVRRDGVFWIALDALCAFERAEALSVLPCVGGCSPDHQSPQCEAEATLAAIIEQTLSGLLWALPDAG